jgi:ribosomal protein S5
MDATCASEFRLIYDRDNKGNFMEEVIKINKIEKFVKNGQYGKHVAILSSMRLMQVATCFAWYL